MASPNSSISAVSQVEARPMPVGKTVVPMAIWPWGISSWRKTGMSRLMKAFANVAARSGVKPVSRVFCVQGSARNVAQRLPPCRESRYFRPASERTAPSAVFSYIGQPSGQSSWPTFSSRVRVFSSASARCSGVSAASCQSEGWHPVAKRTAKKTTGSRRKDSRRFFIAERLNL